MTPQDNRNKRFDEKFPNISYRHDKELTNGSIVFVERNEELKTFLTSEVNLTIEQVETWARLKFNILGAQGSNGDAEQDKRNAENMIRLNGQNEIITNLLSFLTTLKK